MTPASATLLASVIDEAAHGFVILDGDARVAAANGTFAAWCEAEKAELDGRHFGTLLSPASRIYLETHILPQIGMTDCIDEVAIELCRAEGRMPLLLSARAHRRERSVMISCTMLSVPERQLYERELLQERRRAEDALRQLRSTQARLLSASRTAAQNVAATSLAHELNQPLMSAAAQIALAAHLNQSEPASDRVAAALEAAAKGVSDAGTAVKRIRRMTAPRGSSQIVVTPVVLAESACRLVAAEQSSTRLRVDVPTGLPAIACRDADQLAYGIGELILNAIEAIEGQEDGCVRIRAATAGAEIVFAIEDNGPGLCGEDPFAIGYSNKTGHPGLGLPNARTIVEADRGRLRLLESAGGGCRVEITLPVVATENT